MLLPSEHNRLEKYCDEQTVICLDRLKSDGEIICSEWSHIWGNFCAELCQYECTIEFIEISLLRSYVLKDSPLIFLFEAFDEMWIIDGLIYTQQTAMKTIADIILCFRDSVYKEARRHVGRFPRPIAEKTFLVYLQKIEKYIADVLASRIECWMFVPDFIALSRRNLQCSFGGYRFFQNTLYEE